MLTDLHLLPSSEKDEPGKMLRLSSRNLSITLKSFDANWWLSFKAMMSVHWAHGSPVSLTDTWPA